MSIIIACLSVAFAGAQISPVPDRDVNVGYGRSVLKLPDLDGDGIAELAAGAPGLPVREVLGAGRVLIQSGATQEILSEWTSSFDLGFGSSLRSLSDVDGDGVADVLVGYAPEHGTSRTDVRSGRTGRLLCTFEVRDTSVLSVGDVDHDGIPDLLLTREEPWKLVRASDGELLGVEHPTAGRPWREGYYSVAPGELWPIGDINGDGLSDGVLASGAPMLFLSRRRAFDDGRLCLYPVDQRWPLSPAIEQYLPGLDAVLWSAAAAGDLDGDGCPDFFLGVAEPGDSSTLIGVSGRGLGVMGAVAKILTAQPALDFPSFDEHLHFPGSVLSVGNIDGHPGDEAVCLGHPEAPDKRVYALTATRDEPIWTQEFKAFRHYRSEATFARFDDVDGDGVLDVLAGIGSAFGRNERHGSGEVALLSGKTGRPIWKIEESSITDTGRFLAEVRSRRPLLLVQGEREGGRQLRLLRSAAIREEISDLLILHLQSPLAFAIGAPIKSLPGAEAFRSAFMMGPPDDGFEMVLVDAHERLIERYGLVTEPETIVSDYWTAAQDRRERERKYAEAAKARGPLILIQGRARTKLQIDWLKKSKPALLALDAAVIDLNARPPACVVGSRSSLPDAAYLKTHYELGVGPYEFDMTVIAPDGRWLGRFQTVVSAEDVLSSLRYGG